MSIKILYAVQGTGNGHLTRARAIIPCLQKHGQVEVLISGTQADIPLPFKIKYRLKGLSFIFGKSGGVDLWKTVVNSNIKKLFKDIRSLPVQRYDLVVSDFEPVSSWACFFKKVPCIALSNQAIVKFESQVNFSRTNWLGKLILKKYAPGTHKYGFHFKPSGKNVFPPVIRPEIRQQNVTNEGHYTVYLPSYDDKRIIKRLSAFTDVKWQVFSKHNFSKKKKGNITIYPLDNERFIKSMASSNGVICGAGFETPSEALFLGKKLIVVPMKDQYEQQLNANVLEEMGVTVIRSLKSGKEIIENWLKNGHIVPVDYPDKTQEMIDGIIKAHLPAYAEIE